MLSKTNKKILVIDDKESWRRNYELLLEKEGHFVLSAIDYKSAVDLISKHFFHAAIVDLRLVDKDETNEQGMNILEVFHKTGEETGSIIVTGFPTTDRVKRAYDKYNVVDFIEKDEYDEKTLVSDIEKAIQRSTGFLNEQEKNLGVFASQELEKQLNHLPSNDLVNLFRSLTKPIIPLTSYRTMKQKGKINLIFASLYWSRFLGKTVSLQIGNRKRILDIANKLRESGKDVFITTQQSLSGLRYIVELDSENKI